MSEPPAVLRVGPPPDLTCPKQHKGARMSLSSCGVKVSDIARVISDFGDRGLSAETIGCVVGISPGAVISRLASDRRFERVAGTVFRVKDRRALDKHGPDAVREATRQAIREYVQRYGHVPTRDTYQRNRLPHWPTKRQILVAWNASWKRAVADAGYEPRIVGGASSSKKPPEPGLVGTHDAAKLVGYTHDALQRRAKAGDLPATFAGGRWWFRPDDVVAYARARRGAA